MATAAGLNDGMGRRWAAILAAAVSVAGFVYSLCQRTGSDCVTAFSSPWGSWFGMPLAAYAAAFYAAALVVAVGVTVRRRRALYGQGPRFVLLLGWLAVAVTIAMALYITLVLRTFCLYCSVLYAFSLLLLFAGALVAPGGFRRGTLDIVLFRWLRGGGLRATAMTASLFVIALVALSWGYRHAEGLPASDRPCGAGTGALKTTLPQTPLVVGAEHPEWVFVEFVDPACTHCRHLAAKLDDLVERNAETLQLRVYLFPRDTTCVPNDIVNDLQSQFSVHNKACNAAKAVVCAESLQPGSGLSFLHRLYALQDEPQPWFTDQRLAAAAVALGLQQERFEHCLQTDKKGEARIRSDWVRYGYEHGLRATPRVYTIPVQHGELLLGRAVAHDGDKAEGYYEAVLAGAGEPNE
jgi:uncharacterized membrane protein/predicted DsbA family dithiol-disulfide isomerase